MRLCFESGLRQNSLFSVSPCSHIYCKQKGETRLCIPHFTLQPPQLNICLSFTSFTWLRTVEIIHPSYLLLDDKDSHSFTSQYIPHSESPPKARFTSIFLPTVSSRLSRFFLLTGIKCFQPLPITQFQNHVLDKSLKHPTFE